VASVKVAVSASNPATRIIHILDWHFVPRKAFAADLKDAQPDATDEAIAEAYREHLDRVEAVQKAQLAILTALIEKQGLRAVYAEGLTRRDLEVYKACRRVSTYCCRGKGDVERPCICPT